MGGRSKKSHKGKERRSWLRGNQKQRDLLAALRIIYFPAFITGTKAANAPLEKLAHSSLFRNR